jgi:hypothetical protein
VRVPRLVLAVLLVANVVHPMIARADPRVSSADDEPALITAEVRVGYGVSAGGGAGRASLRGSPLVLAARVAVAIREEPRMSGYGGLVVETLDRTGIGGEAGVALEPTRKTRLRAGAIAMVAPYRLWGGAVGGGRCLGGATKVCLDVDADLFVGGSDLPAGSAAVQIMFGVGIGFDAR